MPGYVAGLVCIGALAAICTAILLDAACSWPRIVAALIGEREQ